MYFLKKYENILKFVTFCHKMLTFIYLEEHFIPFPPKIIKLMLISGITANNLRAKIFFVERLLCLRAIFKMFVYFLRYNILIRHSIQETLLFRFTICMCTYNVLRTQYNFIVSRKVWKNMTLP